MKKVNNILRKFVNQLIIALVICPLIITKGNSFTESITIANEFRLNSINLFDFEFTDIIIDENLLIGSTKKSILIYDISDIYSMKLLENFTTTWEIKCITKKDSYIYVGGEELLILHLENDSLELLYDNILIHESIELQYVIQYLETKDNLLLIAGYSEIFLFDLSFGYYPNVTLLEFTDRFFDSSFIYVQFSLDYLLYERIGLSGFRGTIINKFNKTTNTLEEITRLSQNFHCMHYKEHMYTILHDLEPHLFQYDIKNFEMQYTENYVMLDFYPRVRMNFEFHDNCAFIFKTGNMHVYDIENYMIKKIFEYDFESQFSNFKIINNLCFLCSSHRSEIFELKTIKELNYNNSFYLFLFLIPIPFIVYRYYKKRRLDKIEENKTY